MSDDEELRRVAASIDAEGLGEVLIDYEDDARLLGLMDE